MKNYEVKYRKKDGTVIDCLLTARVWRARDGSIGGYQSIVYDMTAFKRTEEALLQSEQRYRSLTNDVLDSSEVGLFVLNAQFQIVWLSQAIERCFGLRREDVIGRDKRQLIHERVRHIFEDPETFSTKVLATYDNNTYIEHFECHVLPDGKLEDRWLQHWSQPIRSGLYVGGRIEHYYDITKRKRTEEAVQQRERYLSGLNDVAEALLAQADAVPFQEFVERIGPATGASRVYVFLHHRGSGGRLLTSQKAAWCAAGISPEIDNSQLPDFSFGAGCSRLQDTLAQGNLISGLVSGFPAEERELFALQGILATLIIPLLIDGELVGCIGFDNCVSEREWDVVAQTFLRAATNDLALAIKRSRAEEQIRLHADNLESLVNERAARIQELSACTKVNLYLFRTLDTVWQIHR